MTLDTQQMNDIIKQTHYPIPTAEELRHHFLGSDRFSVLNMNHAFHQMELDKESQQLFVFNNPFGLYIFKKLVQRISPASAECHEILRRIFRKLAGVIKIKDDQVVHGKGADHDTRLEKVLQTIDEHNITFRAEKCQFAKESLPSLGWYIPMKE